jgi:hypothetical protein
VVVIELYDPSGNRIAEVSEEEAGFTAGKVRAFQANWTVPKNAVKGSYTVGISVYAEGRESLLWRKESAARFAVK